MDPMARAFCILCLASMTHNALAETTQFGAFNIGATRQILHHKGDRNYSTNHDGLYFGIKRGVKFSAPFTLYGVLDGAAGENYKNGLYAASLQVGSGFVTRFAVPFVQAGYELGNLPLDMKSERQYRMHGATIEMGAFVPLVDKFGIEASYRYARPRSNIPISLTTQNHRFMLSVGYYDFALY